MNLEFKVRDKNYIVGEEKDCYFDIDYLLDISYLICIDYFD